MSIEPGTTLPKQIVLRNDPSERNFAATWKLMQSRRRLYGIDPSNFRPRRKSSVVGITPIEPPVKSEGLTLKPLSVTSIDSEELDIDDEAFPLDGEVCVPVPAPAAGEDGPEVPIDETDIDSDLTDEEQADEAYGVGEQA